MNKLAILQLITAMTIFGSIGFFTKHTGLPSLELVFIRCISATIILSSLWLLTKGYKMERWHTKDLFRASLTGVFLVLNWVFLFKAFEEMSISIAISIYNLAPIFVLILGAILLQEKMSWQAVVAIMFCFGGSILIIGYESFNSFTELFQSGFTWALLAAICYALTMFLGKSKNGLTTYALTFTQTIIGIIMLFPFVDFTLYQNLTTENWLYILGTGIIHTGIVYYLFFESIRKLPTVMVSVLVFVDPVVAILLDIWLLHFSPTTSQIIGITLVFGSIFYTIFYPSKRKVEAERK